MKIKFINFINESDYDDYDRPGSEMTWDEYRAKSAREEPALKKLLADRIKKEKKER